jgi:hypothetical protein
MEEIRAHPLKICTDVKNNEKGQKRNAIVHENGKITVLNPAREQRGYPIKYRMQERYRNKRDSRVLWKYLLNSLFKLCHLSPTVKINIP